MRKIINLMFALAAVAFLSATLNAQPAQPVVKPKSFYERRTYTWTNANGDPVTSNLADPATDPRQIMALLKEVYTNKEIPGIWQCGYTDDGEREGTIDYNVTRNDYLNAIYDIPTGNYKPNEEGYTTLIVKVKDTWTPSLENDLSKKETLEYIANSIESVQILTEGIYIPSTGADGKKNPNPGAIYRLSGNANRLFFMSKGRGRAKVNKIFGFVTSVETVHDYAPFNGMFEEYSPVAVSGGQVVENFYTKLVDGDIFKVEHDCSSVPGNEHYFCMMGAQGTKKFDVTDLIVTIPDYRFWYWNKRDKQGSMDINYTNYHKSYAPSLGLYGIQLKATATPAAGDEYTVELKWTSTLNEITGNEIDQRFKVWVRAEDGGLERLLDANGNQVEIAPGETFQYNYNETQGFEGREITYVVSGRPTDKMFNDYKEVYSNDDKVFIPGLDPNEGLRLSIGTTSTSDYDLATETNQYKNLITIDHNLVKTHVRYGNLKAGSKLAFYRYDVDRKSEPKKIAELEIVSVDKREDGSKYYLDYKYNLSFSYQEKEATPKTNLTGATYSLETNYDYTENTTKEIDFNGFKINSFNDEFCASTATNHHPASYEYKASFSELNHDTQKELHSAYSTIKVHKTTPDLTDKAITLEDVENDSVCSTRIYKGEHDASPAIQFTLDQDRRIAEYSVGKIRNKEQSESEEVGLAQRLPSWNYAIYENGSFKQNVSHTEIPQIHDASAKVGKNDYVSVIKTYRDNDGSYNTYGSPINTTYKLKASVEVNENEKVMSEYVFTSNGKKGRYYQTGLKITAYGTDNYEIVKYRVWRQTADRAMEIVPQYKARLQQDTHPIVMNSDNEGNPSIDQNHNNIQEFELVDRPGVGFYPERIDDKSIHVYDTFGASDVSEDGNLDVTYIVRLYAKPEAGNTSARAKATTPILAKEYYIGEATITVSFEKNTPTGLFDFVAETKTPVRVQYVNMLGQKSDTPFSGMNVVITTYTDGSHSTAKRAY
ncbi:MAG: hypothetical protein MSS42_10255 [Bacteroidales bacterium]|nr:hypothetical protein [Bacteroidales bacterium]